MTRHEFDPILKEFFEALQVKANRVQAEYFWDAYKGAHVEDFLLVCRELGRGTPGRLPTPTFFSENLATAREMRVEREKGQEKRWVQKFLKEGPSHHDPMEDLWAKCCAAIIMHDPRKAAAFVREAMDNEPFTRWTVSWKTEAGELAGHWLIRQVERIEAKINRASSQTEPSQALENEPKSDALAMQPIQCL